MNLTSFRPVEAVRSLVAVVRDPDDTSQVFRLLEAVSGGPPPSLVRRFAASRGGAELLSDRPEVLDVLRDRARLAALPEGSLGRAYLAFMERDGLTADWLVEASHAATPHEGASPTDYVGRRLRDTHDLWHVVTGYGGDLLGEAALLAFTHAQTFAPGIGLLVSVALVRADDPDARRLIVDGWARGARAAWLPAQAWERMLAEPLEEVRARLRVGPPPSYDPVRTSDLPNGALFA
jgi:ubiquinone biosynthesis protein COQ4